jgi:hypothetical protein
MSIKIRMTGSEDFGVLEIELDNDHASVGYLQSDDFKTLVGEAIAQQTLTAKALKASHGLTPNVVNEPTQPIVHPSGQQARPAYAGTQWGERVSDAQPQQSATPPAWAQQQPAQQQSGPVCDLCSAPLNYSKTTRGGGMLKCPNYKGVKDPSQPSGWSKTGNGHTMRFDD